MVVICFEFLSTSPICAAQVCVHTYSILKFGAYQSAGEWYISFVRGYEYYLWVYSFFFKQFVVLYKVCVFRVLLIFLECIDINTMSIMYTDHHSSWAKMICIHKAYSKLYYSTRITNSECFILLLRDIISVALSTLCVACEFLRTLSPALPTGSTITSAKHCGDSLSERVHHYQQVLQ